MDGDEKTFKEKVEGELLPLVESLLDTLYSTAIEATTEETKYNIFC